MSVLSTAAQKQVEDTLVTQGALTKEKLTELKDKAVKQSTPFLSLVVSDGHVSDETLTKAIAHVSKLSKQ